MRLVLELRVSIDAGTTDDVPPALAAGLITVTSITVPVLQLAIQQSAACMSSAVVDRYLRRRTSRAASGVFGASCSACSSLRHRPRVIECRHRRVPGAAARGSAFHVLSA